MHPRLGTSRTWPGPARAQGVYARAVRCGPGPVRQILLLVLPFLTWLIQMLNSALSRPRSAAAVPGGILARLGGGAGGGCGVFWARPAGPGPGGGPGPVGRGGQGAVEWGNKGLGAGDRAVCNLLGE